MKIDDFFVHTKPDSSIYTVSKPAPKNFTKLSIGTSKFHFLFGIEKFSYKVFIICLVAIFIGTYKFFILERTGLYSAGIGAVFQSIARCASYFLKKNKQDVEAKAVHTFLFWGMFLIMNIPLAMMGFKKIGHKFTILTILNVVVSSLTSMCWASLPQSWGLKSFYIFSDPRTFNSSLIDNNIQILQWNHVTNVKSGNTDVYMNDSSRITIIFLYGFIFGLLNSVSSVFIYSLGASTGGIDWIIYYYIKNKRKRFFKIYLYMALLITFISYVVGTYVPYADYTLGNKNGNNLNNHNHTVISSLLGPVFVATIISIFVRRIFYHFWYPRWQIVNVKIYTNKAVELRRKLIDSNFPQSFTINVSIGGYKLRHQTVFEVTCFVLDLNMLKSLSKEIDPSCLIISVPVRSLMGKFSVRDNIS